MVKKCKKRDRVTGRPVSYDSSFNYLSMTSVLRLSIVHGRDFVDFYFLVVFFIFAEYAWNGNR